MNTGHDTFIHEPRDFMGQRVLVSLAYMACHNIPEIPSTKQYVEDLCVEHDFRLVRIRRDDVSPELAGRAMPQVIVHVDGVPMPALVGAKTKAAVTAYLAQFGAIEP